MNMVTYDTDLQVKLKTAESDFLSSFASSKLSDLSYFEISLAEIENALDSSKANVSFDTHVMANVVATRISVLAQTFMELEISADATAQSLRDVTTEILDEEFGQLSEEAPNASQNQDHLQRSSTMGDSSDNCEPSHHQIAHEWLVSHINNPYPSIASRKKIASQAHVDVKTVTDWFANARRRIGWTALCKRHFAKDRCAMVDAAQCILSDSDVESDSAGARRVIPYSKVIVDAFRSVKECAARLYDGKVAQSELAIKLGAALPTSTIPAVASKKRKSGHQSSVAPKKATLARQASGASTASSATLFDFDIYPYPYSDLTFVSAPSRKRGASSVWEETRADSDVEQQARRQQSRFKRRRESTSSSATTPSRQPTLIHSTSSPSGTSSPAPITPILLPTSLDLAPPSRAQATSSQTTSLNSLIDDWLATVKSVSPASPADELPLAQGASRKRRNAEQDERENETGRKRAKKARVVSESETSTLFDSGSSVSTMDEYAAEGLYPTSALETFPITLPCADTNSEALYALTSTLDFTVPGPALSSELLSGNEFGNALEFGNTCFDIGLGLNPASQTAEDQPLEVGMGSYGFDFASGVEPHFGFEFGTLSSPGTSVDGSLGLELGAGADLASVLQQLHPTTIQERPQPEFEAMPWPLPESVPLPAQGAEEVATLSGPEQVTLSLSEEELAALAGCLQGNELDLSEDVSGLGFDTLQAPVAATVSCLTMPPAIDVDSLERDAKLTRLQSLLAEVSQLQQEVFL